MRTRLMFLGAVLFALAAAPVARADTITFYFAGVITSSTGSFASVVPDGTHFSGFYTFDPNVVDANASSYIGSYLMGSEYNLFAQVGSYSFTQSSLLAITVFDVPSGFDQYSVRAASFSTFTNIDLQGNLLSSDSLPLLPPDILLATNLRQFEHGLWDGSGWMRGDLTSLTTTPQPVPEPATLLLVGSGLVALGLRRRER